MNIAQVDLSLICNVVFGDDTNGGDFISFRTPDHRVIVIWKASVETCYPLVEIYSSLATREAGEKPIAAFDL